MQRNDDPFEHDRKRWSWNGTSYRPARLLPATVQDLLALKLDVFLVPHPTVSGQQSRPSLQVRTRKPSRQFLALSSV
jgi:hypothetical protein